MYVRNGYARWHWSWLKATCMIAMWGLGHNPSVQAGSEGGENVGMSIKGSERIKRALDGVWGDWNEVETFLVEFESFAGVPEETPSGTHWIIAAADSGRLYFRGAHFGKGMPWRMDPFSQELHVRDGKACHRRPFFRAFSHFAVEEGSDVPESLADSIILTVLPRWPTDAYKLPVHSASGVPIIPTDALRSKDYRVVDEKVRVGEEWCVALDYNGVDRMWISVEKGPYVMRREFRGVRSGRLLQRITVQQVEEIARDVWLPTAFKSTVFGWTEKGDWDIQAEFWVSVVRTLLNEKVPGSVFEINHGPGAIEYQGNEFTQVEGGGKEILSKIVRFIVDYRGLPNGSPHRMNGAGFLVFGIVGALLTIGGWRWGERLASRWRRKKTRK